MRTAVAARAVEERAHLPGLRVALLARRLAARGTSRHTLALRVHVEVGLRDLLLLRVVHLGAGHGGDELRASLLALDYVLGRTVTGISDKFVRPEYVTLASCGVWSESLFTSFAGFTTTGAGRVGAPD